MDFNYRAFSSNTFFGVGKLSVIDDLVLPFERIMLIAGGSATKVANEVTARWKDKKLLHFSKVIQHVPEELVNEAHQELRKQNSQVLVAIGGGSAIGLAKALALETRVPIFAVPTTYAGSEQTDIWGITAGSSKKTGRVEHVVPKVVIYDPNLTVSMPKILAVTSAMNAMAHLMEAAYSPLQNPITTHVSFLGMKVIKEGLEKFKSQAKLSTEVNEKLLFGAYLGGKCLAEVPMSLHHKAAHVLGGTFGLDHASVHTVLLPYVLAYQWPALSEDVSSEFVHTLGSNPPLSLKTLAENVGATTNLKSLSFKESDIEKAADLLLQNPYPNPAPLNRSGMINLLTSAFNGTLPLL
jgi:maleylacetate reductase